MRVWRIWPFFWLIDLEVSVFRSQRHLVSTHLEGIERLNHLQGTGDLHGILGHAYGAVGRGVDCRARC